MENKIVLSQNFKIENATTDENGLKIEGMCCHYNKKNLNNEVVDEKSFDAFFTLYNDGKIKPNLNWNHTDVIIGGIDTIESKSNGLFIVCHLNGDVAIVRDMIEPNIKAGDIDSFSTEGGLLNGYEDIVELGEGGYYVKNFLLFGVGIVANPADWDAKFTVANYINQYNLQKQIEKETIEKNSKWFLI